MTQHALVIGINQTQDRFVHDLRFAEADAQAIHTTLAEHLGFGSQARLLLKPNLSQVRQALTAIEQQVRAGDTLVLYFAGHGAQHNQEQYLLLHEVSLLELERGDLVGNDVLSLGSVMRRVAEWPGVQAAYILDACRTPLRSGGRSTAYSAHVQDLLQGVVARDLLLRTKKAQSPALVINACADGEQAYELEALGRGQFSLALQQWLHMHPRPVLGRQAALEIAALVDAAAQQHQGRRGQHPWVPEDAPDVVLGLGSTPATTATTDTPFSTGHSSLPLSLPKLLALFEAQLATGKLRSPAWDCCIGTITLLHQTGLDDSVLKAMEGRVTQAEATRPVANAGPTPTPTSIALAQRPAGFVFRDADWAPEMVVIPAGQFLMGSPESEPERSSNESPQHPVHIEQAFAMGRCVVTFEDYDRYATERGVSLPSDNGWGRGRMPVINVSWDDAQAYIAWLNQKLGLTAPAGYRLPSEAEWEYAARAGTNTPYWWGSGITPDLANYKGNVVYEGGGSKGEYRQKTVRADEFKANGWGLYNVHGNVYEWVQDYWHDSYKGAPKTGRAWEEGCGEEARRVVRGGSWIYVPWGLRSANRNWDAPDNRSVIIGFRLARTF